MTSSSISPCPGLDVTFKNGICYLRLNRPRRLNSLTIDMYVGVREVLNATSNDDNVKLLYITGTGRYFTSGNDFVSIATMPPEEREKLGDDFFIQNFKEFVKAFINYSKIIVVGVNGPAIGVGATILPLADFVYASDSATFETPFTKLGISPEGCSSYTFPKIMGYAFANDLLIGSRKITAQEAYERGLLTDVVRDEEFHNTIEERIAYLSSLPNQSVLNAKWLIRREERDLLLKINEIECARLKERTASEECMNAIMTFMAAKSQSSKL